MPTAPDQVYMHGGWQGWDHWLGASDGVPPSTGVRTTAVVKATGDEKGGALKKGDMVKARWRGGRKLYTGSITGVNGNGTVDITYADGDTEGAVDPALVTRHAAARAGPTRTSPPSPPPALPPTKVIVAGVSMTFWEAACDTSHDAAATPPTPPHSAVRSPGVHADGRAAAQEHAQDVLVIDLSPAADVLHVHDDTITTGGGEGVTTQSHGPKPPSARKRAAPTRAPTPPGAVRGPRRKARSGDGGAPARARSPPRVLGTRRGAAFARARGQDARCGAQPEPESGVHASGAAGSSATAGPTAAAGPVATASPILNLDVDAAGTGTGFGQSFAQKLASPKRTAECNESAEAPPPHHASPPPPAEQAPSSTPSGNPELVSLHAVSLKRKTSAADADHDARAVAARLKIDATSPPLQPPDPSPLPLATSPATSNQAAGDLPGSGLGSKVEQVGAGLANDRPTDDDLANDKPTDDSDLDSRRRLHNLLEQKRRGELKASYQQLRQQLPTLADATG